MTAGWHKAVVTIGYLLAILVISIALITSILSLLNPWLSDHRHWLEQKASRSMGKTVAVGSLGVTWDLLSGPLLNVANVTVIDPATQKTVITFKRILIRVAIWRSLVYWQLRPESIELSGAEVTLPPADSNTAGLVIPEEAQSVLTWLLAEPELVLRDVVVNFSMPHDEAHELWVQWLHLENSLQRHMLQATVMVPQEIQTTGQITAVWHDEASLHPKHLKVAAAFEGLTLGEWLKDVDWKGIQLRGGLGDLRLWAEWKTDRWQQVEVTTELYNLVLRSQKTGKQHTIDRVGGNFGWRQTGTSQQFAGDDIVIDLPEHLWPYTHFSLTATPRLADQPASLRLSLGYLDLGDTIDWLMAGGLLPDVLQQWLPSLKLSGAVDSLNATVTGDDFSKGLISLNSRDVVMTLNQVFNAPISVSVLQGDFGWNRNSVGTLWLWGHALEAYNADGAAKAEVSLSLPEKGSPVIQLSGNFSLQHGEHIARYLPMKLFNTALSKWLTAAFTGGTVNHAEVVWKGSTEAFPYDHHEGTFLIKGAVAEVGVHLAEGWPDIQHATGELTFSGRNMIADIRSADLMKFRLKSVQGVIPLMGLGNPVLSLSGKARLSVSQGWFDFTNSKGSLVITGKGVESGNLKTMVTSNVAWYNALAGKSLPLTLKMGPGRPKKIDFQHGGLTGDVTFPGGDLSHGVKIHMPRLFLSPLQSGMTDAMSPEGIPPVGFVGDDVRYGQMRLGRLTLSFAPVKGGIRIGKLDLQSALFQVAAEGTWLKAGTRFTGSVQTDHTDQFLAAIGEGSANFKAGPGKIQFNLSWPGSPAAFSLKNLQGTVSIAIGRGLITHLDNETTSKMGLGRMLSVFSLQTLPRRLSLDFSDLFENGYSFDAMRGDFTLKNGNAVTNNASIRGVVAHVSVKGRLGLVAHDYDLNMDIMPHVTASLPVVAAIAAANPLIGVATWMVNSAVSPEVSKITMYRYRITGSWEHPVWQKVNGSAS